MTFSAEKRGGLRWRGNAGKHKFSVSFQPRKTSSPGLHSCGAGRGWGLEETSNPTLLVFSGQRGFFSRASPFCPYFFTHLSSPLLTEEKSLQDRILTSLLRNFQNPLGQLLPLSAFHLLLESVRLSHAEWPLGTHSLTDLT